MIMTGLPDEGKSQAKGRRHSQPAALKLVQLTKGIVLELSAKLMRTVLRPIGASSHFLIPPLLSPCLLPPLRPANAHLRSRRSVIVLHASVSRLIVTLREGGRCEC